MNHNITDLGIPAESELRGIGIIWYKRDLRVDDHPALTLGAEIGAVLPIYIVEPDYWALADTSARQW